MITRGRHHDPQYNVGNNGGEFGVSYHLEMLGDRERIDRCIRAIQSVADKRLTFCELGAGSGVFSIVAAKLFAQVIAIERDDKMVAVMRDAARRSGLTNIHIHHGDVLGSVDLSLLSSVDVLFCEMMSTWLIVEPQVLVMNKIASLIDTNNIIRVPSKVHNLLEVGNYDYEIMDIQLPAAIPQFSGIRSPRILSASVLAHTHDLSVVNNTTVASGVEVTILASGIANCVRLSSIVQLAPLISFYSTDTLMPPLIVPLCSPVEVKEGNVLRIDFSYQCRSSLEHSIFTATIIQK